MSSVVQKVPLNNCMVVPDATVGRFVRGGFGRVSTASLKSIGNLSLFGGEAPNNIDEVTIAAADNSIRVFTSPGSKALHGKTSSAAAGDPPVGAIGSSRPPRGPEAPIRVGPGLRHKTVVIVNTSPPPPPPPEEKSFLSSRNLGPAGVRVKVFPQGPKTPGPAPPKVETGVKEEHLEFSKEGQTNGAGGLKVNKGPDLPVAAAAAPKKPDSVALDRDLDLPTQGGQGQGGPKKRPTNQEVYGAIATLKTPSSSTPLSSRWSPVSPRYSSALTSRARLVYKLNEPRLGQEDQQPAPQLKKAPETPAGTIKVTSFPALVKTPVMVPVVGSPPRGSGVAPEAAAVTPAAMNQGSFPATWKGSPLVDPKVSSGPPNNNNKGCSFAGDLGPGLRAAKDGPRECNTLGSSTLVMPPVVTDATPQHSHRIVVAIDFGTTYSGYAYSFAHEPDNVHIMRKWEGTTRSSCI